MPFPPPPAARQPPRRPGAPRKVAAPACAPPGPPPPAAAGEKKKRPPERPEAPLSRSWPSATLKRPPARRAPGPAPARTPAPGRPHPPVTACTGDSPAGPAAAARFSLRLAPEAVRLVQRRHLEKQLLARPRRPLPAPSADARRLLAPGPRRGGDPGDPRSPELGLRRLLKVSLLNDQHKYDDVEYEEEATAVDEGLVRKCTEWLRGVESATAARDHTGALDVLPHLSAL